MRTTSPLANHFGGRKSGNLRRQHQIDFQNHIRLQEIFRLEQQTGAADVFGLPVMPFFFVETAVLQRQVKLKTLRARRRRLVQRWHSLDLSSLSGHGNLLGDRIQNFANFVFQIVQAKGLLEQAYTRVQRAVAADHIFRVTGHVENFHIGTNFRNALRQFAAVHAGHDHIRQQQMNGSFVRDCDLHRDRAVGGFDHAVTLLLEELPGQVAQVGLVLNQQDGFRSRLGGCGFRGSGDLLGTFGRFRDAR